MLFRSAVVDVSVAVSHTASYISLMSFVMPGQNRQSLAFRKHYSIPKVTLGNERERLRSKLFWDYWTMSPSKKSHLN